MFIDRHADTLVVRTPAKVNLFLEILNKRPDGYHELVTLMVAVRLFDILTFKEESTDVIRFTCDDPRVPASGENLVWRATELIRRETGCKHGVHIQLQKQIPMAAGLGGGSSDAAATLVALNRLWKLRLATPELIALAARLGSDVPFFISATAAWCTGRGELVAPFQMAKPLHLVLACPAAGLSTAEVYRQVVVPKRPRSPERMKRALATGDVEAIGAAVFNRLQPVAERRCAEVKALRSLFGALAPAGHLMSGSGSSYVALCRSQRAAQALARQVRQRYRSPKDGRTAGRGLRLFVVRSLSADSTA
jgi:4-diphosphocytidyl-2-C-methyl-D-erythritol kinase